MEASPYDKVNKGTKLITGSRACSHYQDGGAGSQFFSNQGVRSDAYRVSASDDRRRVGENWPRPFGFHPCDEDLSPGPRGCGENPAILHSRPRRWTRHSLRARLRLARFSLATPPARKLITGSSPGSGRSL